MSPKGFCGCRMQPRASSTSSSKIQVGLKVDIIPCFIPDDAQCIAVNSLGQGLLPGAIVPVKLQAIIRDYSGVVVCKGSIAV